MSKFALAAIAAGFLLVTGSAFADEKGHGDEKGEMGHGDAMDQGDDDHHGAGMMAFGRPGDADQATRTIEVVMGDYYYEPENITVAAGETVRFVIRNDGGVVHEFNIGTAESHVMHQEEMMMMVDHGVLEVDRINYDMMNMDMGDGQMMRHDDPNSALLEPGKEAEIVWTFAKAGDLEFACNVPGHYDAGMMGPLTVTQ